MTYNNGLTPVASGAAATANHHLNRKMVNGGRNNKSTDNALHRNPDFNGGQFNRNIGDQKAALPRPPITDIRREIEDPQLGGTMKGVDLTPAKDQKPSVPATMPPKTPKTGKKPPIEPENNTSSNNNPKPDKDLSNNDTTNTKSTGPVPSATSRAMPKPSDKPSTPTNKETPAPRNTDAASTVAKKETPAPSAKAAPIVKNTDEAPTDDTQGIFMDTLHNKGFQLTMIIITSTTVGLALFYALIKHLTKQEANTSSV